MILSRKLLYFAILLASTVIILPLGAQDTIVVNAMNYDTETRQVMVPFPEEGEFRKVEMLYSMRCHDLAIGTGNVGCKEWDYHCNTVLTVPEREDSLRATHPSCLISDWTGSTFFGTEDVTFEQLTFDSELGSLSAGGAPTLLGNADATVTLDGDSPQHMTYIYTSEELNSAGITAGDISGITLPVENIGSVKLNHLNVVIGNTDLTTATGATPETLFSGSTATYYHSTELSGNQQLIFEQPLAWDGTSNIAIQVSYQDATGNLELGTETVADMGLIKNKTDRFAALSGKESWLLDNDFTSVGNQITISFWSNGDDALPVNTVAFEGVDANNTRQANVHLPWSNATIFWDCGNDGSNYDRISKGATFADFKNGWVHWTFIKDLNIGEMKILRNGELWHSATGNNRMIDIQKFVLGADHNGNTGYRGFIDDFRVWRLQIPEQTIKDYMYRDLDDDHPFNSFLLADYRMDEMDGTAITDSSPAAGQGLAEVAPANFAHGDRRVNSIAFKNLSITNERPTFSLIQSTATVTPISATFIDSLANQPNIIECFDIVNGDLTSIGTDILYETEQDLATEVIEIEELTFFNKTESRYEILSFITPYGNGLDLGPDGKQFTIDVTDYLPIMKGERLLTVEGRGNNQEELDITFRFIEGTPSRDILDIKQLWPVRPASAIWFGYGFDDIKADNVFERRELTLDPDASMYKIRSSVTGHGQNGEFTNQGHFIDIDGGAFREFQYNVWKECSENPMYPQGGTWIFDRAGWCPGMETDVHEFEMGDWVVPGQTITLDYGLTTNTLSDADYRINNQLVTYGPYNFALDAEILTVMRPTDQYEFQRYNPACNTPLIMVKNSGGDQISSMEIEYGLENGNKLTYEWTGVINPEQEVEIELPIFSHSIWGENTEATFGVEIISVNNSLDENIDNNSYQTTYNPVHIFERNFRIALRTNSVGSDTRYQIRDSSGEVVISRGGIAGNTEVNDIIDLPGGCYTLTLEDVSDDGLFFWFFSANGTGFFRLDEIGDDESFEGVVWQPNPDFGGDLQFEFMVRGTTDVNEIEDSSLLSIAPIPADNQISVVWEHDRSDKAQLTILDYSGKQVYSMPLKNKEKVTIPTSNLNSGQYILRIQHEHGNKSEWISILR